jgi:hypothetical protein
MRSLEDLRVLRAKETEGLEMYRFNSEMACESWSKQRRQLSVDPDPRRESTDRVGQLRREMRVIQPASCVEERGLDVFRLQIGILSEDVRGGFSGGE